MRDGDFSRRDRAILEGEIQRQAGEEIADRNDTVMRDNPSDFEVLMGYINELKIRYDIVIPKFILDRLRDLEKFTKPHNRDARVIYEAFFQVFHQRRKTGHDSRTPDLSEEDLGVGLTACLLHDIGKSGPVNASRKKREAIGRLYSLEVLPDGPETPINTALQFIFKEASAVNRGENLVEKINIYLSDLKNMGFEPNNLMGSFFRVHAQWTNDILSKNLDQKNSGYRRITKIASSHHYLEGDNPEKVDLQAQNLSEEEHRDNYLIKLLIVLDQYQGARRRGKKTPAEAKDYIVSKLNKKGFAEDPDFLEIIALVEEVDALTPVFAFGRELDVEVKK